MRRIVFVGLFLLSLPMIIAAKGTLAGTSITNQAQIHYAVGGIDGNLTSNTDAFVIDRVVDIEIDWEDTAPIEVGAGDTDRVLTFLLSNIGNADENITLTYEHNATSQFAPEGVTVYVDDGDGLFDPAHDSSVTLVLLAADRNVTLFLVGTIPENNTTTPGSQSYEAIRATAESNATAGADRPDQVDVVVRKGVDADTGSWVIRNYWIVTEKSATVHSEDNATHTGTHVTYTIDTYIDGNTTGRRITDVVVTDAIPEGSRYLSGTLRLDTTLLSDASDGDKGEADAAAVVVRIGTLSGATHQKIHFDVEVE